VDDVDGLRERLGQLLTEHDVVFSYVFGSVARGDARPDSDVDLAVAFPDVLPASERFDRTLRLGAAVEALLDRQVDLVDLAEAPLRLQGRILTERVVLTGLGSPERVRFETDLFPRYIDADYHARRLDAEILAATAAGRR
jgi:uncharacterized protein